MRTLNLRFAAICLIVIGVVGGGVHALHGIQVKRHANTFLEAADRAWKAAVELPVKETADRVKQVKLQRQAIEYLGAYLRLMPNDLQARKDQGFWLDELGLPGRAYPILEELVRAMERQGASPAVLAEVRRKLVKVAIAINRPVDATGHINILLADARNDPQLLDLRGQCQVSSGKDSDAADSFQLALKLAPQQIDTYPHLALVLQRLQLPVEADKCMEQLIKKNGRSPRAYQLHTHYLLERGKIEEAVQQAERLLALMADAKADDKDKRTYTSDALSMAGRGCLELRKFDKAEGFAQRGIQADGKDKEMYILLGDIYERSGRRDKALATLKQGMAALRGTPGYAEVLWHATNLQLDAKHTDEAAKSVAEMRRLGLGGPRMDCLDARIDFARERWPEALAGFERARPLLTDTLLLRNVHYWIGFCYGQVGKIEQQMAAYREAVKIDPGYFPARNGIAEILIGEGKLKEAVQEYRQGYDANHPSEPLLIALARTMVLFSLQTGQRWMETAQFVQEVAKTAPTSSEVAMLIIQMLIGQGRYDLAELRLQMMRDQAPNVAELWTTLATVAELRDHWSDAEQYLNEAQARLGDGVTLRLGRAQYRVRHDGRAALPEIKRQAENVAAFSAEEKCRLWSTLATYCSQVEDVTTAKELYELVAKTEPRNVRVRYLLCELALRAGRSGDMTATFKELDRLLEEIAAAGGRSPIWYYAKAIRLRLEGDPASLDAALQFARRAREERPAWPRPVVVTGQIHDQQGRRDLALKDFQEAIRLGEHDLDVVHRVIQLLSDAGQYKEAERHFAHLDLSEANLTHEFLRDIALLSFNTRDIDTTLRRLRQAYNQDSTDYRDHLWQGQKLGVLARRAKAAGRKIADEIATEAEKDLREALRLRPSSADCWVALVRLLVSTGQPERARAEIAKAQESVARRESPLAMAHCYEALQDWTSAEAMYTVALEIIPDNAFVLRQVTDFYLRIGQDAKAEPLVKQMLAGKVPASGTDRAWARRTLALVLARGGYAHLAEALRLIDENLASADASLADTRAKARLLLLDPRPVRQREARDLIKGLGEGRDMAPEDRFELAQLYLLQGEFGKYLIEMRGLLASGSPQAEHLRSYLGVLLQRNELKEADTVLPWLQQLEPDEFSTVDLEAELKFRNNDSDRAYNILMAYLDRTRAQPDNRTDRLLPVAQRLENLGNRLNPPGTGPANRFVAKAEALYREFSAQRPGNDLLVAGFLARQGKVREALEMLERCAPQASPPDILAAAAPIIHGKASAEQLRQLEQVLVAAQERLQHPLALLFTLADLYTTQERYPAAIAAYREVLAKDPGNVLARNNLGAVLALTGNDLKEALQLLDRAIELEGPQGVLLDSRAVVHIARQSPDEALADLDGAIAQAPTAVRYFHRARALLLADKKGEAAAAMETARRKGLRREMLDPPERPIFDKLRDTL